MSEIKRWVQHISGQGEKWELCNEGGGGNHNATHTNDDWQVYTKKVGGCWHAHFLPKSEYRLCDPPCDPPEEWEDVTGRVRTGEFLVHNDFTLAKWIYGGAYRLRKIDGLHNGPAFIIERRKS